MTSANGSDGGPQRAPEETRLDFLVGPWQAAGVVHPGRFGPGGTCTGDAEYRWDLRGKWLTYTSRLTLPGLGLYEVRGGVAYDPRAGRYRAFAFNNLGVLLAYDGAWEDDARLVFYVAYPDAREKSRIAYTRLADGSVQLVSESAADGVRYEAYFETMLTRARESGAAR